jgi:hypothetical protein
MQCEEATMPYTTRLTPSGADIRFTGVVTRALVEQAMAEAAACSVGAPLGYMLRDYTAIDRLDVSSADVRALTRFYADEAGPIAPSLVAIVAVRPVEYGLARMWELIAEDSGAYGAAHVARSRAEAVAWLVAYGVPAGELAP